MSKMLLLGFMIATVGFIAVAGSDEKTPPPLPPDSVKAGGTIYQQYCASCHGAHGEGAANWTEPDNNGELPAPPHDSEGHTWKHSDAMIYQMVARGWRDPFNKTKRLSMPAFADMLSAEQIRSVITYLKTLWKPQQRLFQWEESKDQPFPPKVP
jgi:mono/diheme cytochrome c family protein